MQNQKKAPLSGEYVKDYYNSFLEDSEKSYTDSRWLGSVIGRAHFSQTKRAFEKILGKENYRTALEIGGGDGLWTSFLLPHIGTLDFVDIAHEMIRRAQERFKNITTIVFHCIDFLHFVSDTSYDCIVSFRSFEYIEDKQKAVQKFSSMLTPGGTLIIVTKSPYYDWSGYYTGRLLHTGQWPLATLCRELKTNGFRIIEIRPAIIGKRFDSGLMRGISSLLHRICLRIPWRLLPFSVLQYVSESFIIKSQKL